MCAGFPRLGVLRRLRPVPGRSAVGAPSPGLPAGCRRQGKTGDGSRVHCGSLVGVGARLCPCGLAASTPQTFPAASRSPASQLPGSSPPRRVRAAPGPDPPGSSQYSVKGRYGTGSSRTPLRPAHRTYTIWQCWRTPALSGLLLPTPAPPGTGCPQLLPDRCDGPAVVVLHLHSNHSASRRTKPALNAFAVTFGDRFPAAETY